MATGEHGSNNEKRTEIISNTRLLGAVLDTQKVGPQWEGQLSLQKSLVLQRISEETSFGTLNLSGITEILEKEHFYYQTTKFPQRRGVSRNTNIEITSLVIGIAYEVGNIQDLVFIQDELYNQLAAHYPESVNKRLSRAERHRQIGNLFVVGINLRAEEKEKEAQLSQQHAERRKEILANSPFTAAFLSNKFNPFNAADDYHQQWIEEFSLLYRQKKEEITPPGNGEDWLDQQINVSGLEKSFPPQYNLSKYLCGTMQ